MKSLLFLVPLFSTFLTSAQPQDYTKDVSSPDAIIETLYGVISGDAGQPRDWTRFRNLFVPEARMIPTRKSDKGELTAKSLTPDEYVTLFTSRVSTGFYEREVHRVTESYGTLTHIFSTYETNEKKDGPATSRGINSVQLFYDGQRYYIVTIFWCAESLGFPLPGKYIQP